MKYCITIFVMPYELLELKNTVKQLNKASKYLSENGKWVIDIKLSISDYLVDWDTSHYTQEFFINSMEDIAKSIHWADVKVSTSTEIMGCVSQRRTSLIENGDCDYFIWLDTDIVFDERTLAYIELATLQIQTEYNIITPEIVRIWDSTWDCLVNDGYLDKPLGYHLDCDTELESGIKGDIMVVGVINRIPNQPRFKFSGGWFTCISSKLLKRIGIPESFGHYGMEDTFVMWASEKLVQMGVVDIQQYKIKNLIVCEEYKTRGNNDLMKSLTLINRKEEFKNIAVSNFQNELFKVK